MGAIDNDAEVDIPLPPFTLRPTLGRHFAKKAGLIWPEELRSGDALLTAEHWDAVLSRRHDRETDKIVVVVCSDTNAMLVYRFTPRDHKVVVRRIRST